MNAWRHDGDGVLGLRDNSIDFEDGDVIAVVRQTKTKPEVEEAGRLNK